MKRHALFFATALAVASLGTAGLAAAQSAPVAPANDTATVDGQRVARGERPARDGKHRFGHHGRRGPGGHGMHGGIERMDADGDGRVSRAEFDAANAAREEAREARVERMAERRAARAQSGEAPRQARDGRPDGPRMGQRAAIDFDAIDANRDGYLVRTEVAAHRERTRDAMRAAGEKRFAEAFAAADLNRDGRLSRVEVDEKMPRLSKRFAWMDDNRDGVLSRAELEAGKRGPR